MASQRGSTLLAVLILATSVLVILADDYSAKLTGDQSVPPVQSSTEGTFELNFNKNLFTRSYVDYKVSTNGPITPKGQIVQGRLYADNFQGSFRGKSIGDLEDAVDNKRVYGLISYQTGALRGYFKD